MGLNGIELLGLNGFDLWPRSVVNVGGAEVGLVRDETGSRVAALAPPGSSLPAGLAGKRSRVGGGTLFLGPASDENLDALRTLLPWLHPRPLGSGTSAGMGDRLGLATPGHVRAVRATGGKISPIFAQQSIREMERTGRTPRQVLNEATWGVFAEGWREGFGADADHLKTAEHIDACVAAGYTFFTFDPGDHVDDRGDSAYGVTLRTLLDDLPWDRLESSEGDLMRRYVGGRIELEGHEIHMTEEVVARAAAKYGPAVAHATGLYRHLEGVVDDRPFEVEVSVDETGSPTTHAQHVYIAGELDRLGVRWVSLAPRYVGSFEKGVDYIGDVEEFEEDIAAHAAIARAASSKGPYKLSLHSGSDKFSIYGPSVRQTRGLIHLKTAGTSYLEALRTVAGLDTTFFREIYAFARGRYEEDRASYHVSASASRSAMPESVPDEELPGLLDRFDEREVLHVTFGSVLGEERFRGHLFSLLRVNPDSYAEDLEAHFIPHLRPFAGEESRPRPHGTRVIREEAR